MGNTESNVTSGVKGQADASSKKIYSLMDVNGGGELIEWTKQLMSRKITQEKMEEEIRRLVEPFLYNKGQGKLVPVTEMVMLRNKERPKNKQINLTKGQTKMCNDNNDQTEAANGSTVNPADIENPKYRDVCWDLDQRGSVGETAIHLCFLVSSTVHAELAKQLIKVYPKLLNDYYTCDEYYGETALHMAIVNEDPAMVKLLLDNGANYHERCVGNFFIPEDQKPSRMDNLDHEWVDLCTKTNYEGYVYWGEYPLSFAACLNQEECFRLLLAKGADPDKQDTNGNSVAHIMVIENNMNMFDQVYELGATTHIYNMQGLTPLTLAAKLARQDLFMHILKLQREIYWQLGNITCAAYPLEEIDTINSQTGEIFKESALNLVVYGERAGHLDMMEGLLVDLLNAKWNTFIKFKFYAKFLVFAIYFVMSIGCFVLRPAPLIKTKSSRPPKTTVTVNTTVPSYISTTNDLPTNISDGFTTEINPLTIIQAFSPFSMNASQMPEECYLLVYDTPKDKTRLVFEVLAAVGAFLYIIQALNELKFMGKKTFFENLSTVPSRVLFLISCIVLVVIMVPLRLTCQCHFEDNMAVVVMLLTAPHFLFFCRGFKMVGPFVVMIYKMVQTDLLCFVSIYLVFVMGFSQAYFVIHQSHDNKNKTSRNFFETPVESFMALFVMSVGTFGEIYGQFDNTDHPYIAKILFFMYATLVATLLLNMLIAMMGKTYQDIAERKNEWMRQWARIVMVVERGVSPKECLDNMIRYSEPMAEGRRGLVIRHHYTGEEKEELEELLDLKLCHIENRKKKKRGTDAPDK